MLKHCLLALALGIIGGSSGCKNACDELADTICERAGKDLDVCKASPPAPPTAPALDAKPAPDPCDKMRAMTATCETLRTEAAKATAEDKDGCRADLELMRALDKQQM